MTFASFRLPLTLCLCSIGTAPLLASPPVGHPEKLSKDAAAYTSSAQIPVIIQYKQDPGSPQAATIGAFGGVLKEPCIASMRMPRC